MEHTPKLIIDAENVQYAMIIDEQVAKFRKETLEMRKQEDELRAQRLIKHRRAAVWVNRPEALQHIRK
jgi:hypothetical protein